MDKLEYYTLYFACAHKDFAHDIEATKTKDKAYYAVAYFELDNEFVRNFNTAHSPAIVVRDMVETFERDKVPFYCAAWSNIKSVRSAIRSGFRPAWAEMTAKPAAFVDGMNTGKEA